MAFSDPQSVTIGTAQSLPRIGSDFSSGIFQKDDGTVTLTIRHSKPSKANRVRSSVDVVFTKIVADPLVTGTNLRLSSTTRVTLDRPRNGFTIAELVSTLSGLSTWLTASTNANATKFVGMES